MCFFQFRPGKYAGFLREVFQKFDGGHDDAAPAMKLIGVWGSGWGKN